MGARFPYTLPWRENRAAGFSLTVFPQTRPEYSARVDHGVPYLKEWRGVR